MRTPTTNQLTSQLKSARGMWNINNTKWNSEFLNFFSVLFLPTWNRLKKSKKSTHSRKLAQFFCSPPRLTHCIRGQVNCTRSYSQLIIIPRNWKELIRRNSWYKILSIGTNCWIYKIACETNCRTECRWQRKRAAERKRKEMEVKFWVFGSRWHSSCWL